MLHLNPTGASLGDTPVEDQQGSNANSLVVAKTPINNVVLGAPFGDSSDLEIRANIPSPSFASPTAAAAHYLRPARLIHRQIQAGCVWDKDNWLCSYDSVLMSILCIYRNSSPGWRNKWKQQAPRWNDSFGTVFDSLLEMPQGGRSSQAALSHSFTSFRETFRDDLFCIDQARFRRHGQVPASVCHIFSRIFMAGSGPSMCKPHLEQVAACDHCHTLRPMHCPFGLLGSSDLLDIHRHEGDIGPFLQLQTMVTRYIQYASHDPNITTVTPVSGRTSAVT